MRQAQPATGRMGAVLGLNLALVGAALGVGLSAHSVGVLAQAVDDLLDAGAIALSLLAAWVARHRRGPVPARAEALAALATAAWLVAASLLVMGGAAYRLVTGAGRVDGLAVLAMSGVAALVLMGGALLLHQGRRPGDGLATRAVLLDTAADALSAAGVALAGGIILAAGGLYWLDPVVALVISALVAGQALVLVREATAHLHPG